MSVLNLFVALTNWNIAFNILCIRPSFSFSSFLFPFIQLSLSKWKFHHSSLNMISKHDLMSNCWGINYLLMFCGADNWILTRNCWNLESFNHLTSNHLYWSYSKMNGEMFLLIGASTLLHGTILIWSHFVLINFMTTFTPGRFQTYLFRYFSIALIKMEISPFMFE